MGTLGHDKRRYIYKDSSESVIVSVTIFVTDTASMELLLY